MNKFQKLIIEGINEEIKGSLIARLVQVKQNFEKEMIYNNRIPSPKILQEWLMGLCGTIYVPFENYEIIKWYETHLNRKIEAGVPDRGKARYETLIANYWPQLGKTLYTMLYP